MSDDGSQKFNLTMRFGDRITRTKPQASSPLATRTSHPATRNSKLITQNYALFTLPPPKRRNKFQRAKPKQRELFLHFRSEG